VILFGAPRRRPRRLLGTAVGCAALALCSAGPASAATYHAAGTASLEAAVAKANAASGSSTIELAAGQYLPETTLTVRRDIAVVGPAGPPGAVIGGGSVTPFPSDLLRVEPHAELTLRNVEVSDGGGEGAPAIDDFGAVVLEYSTVAGNSGSGLWVQPGASAVVRNSTLSDGRAFAIVDDGKASLLSTTVASNKGGGIENRGTLSLTNTIVAANGGSGDCEGRASVSDHSLDSDGSCGVGVLARSNPELGRLAGNEGPTPTEALEAGSPAIGRGDASKCPSEDQRHFSRPPGACDIGAYQTNAVKAGSPAGPGGGSGSAPASGGLEVRAHGTLRGRRHSRITFKLLARAGRGGGTLRYDDAARRVLLTKLTLSSLAFDRRRGEATLRGSAALAGSRRRVHVTLVLVSHGGLRGLRIRLSSGYYESGALLGGAITFAGG